MFLLGATALSLALGQTPASTADIDPCLQSPLGLSVLLRCARSASPAVRAAELEVTALEGRRTAASVALPSRPVLELRAAQREQLGNPQMTAFNGGLTLSQEFELGGQRGSRTAAVDAELTSARSRREVVGRNLDAAVLRGFFGLLAAQEEEELASAISSSATTLARSARERAARELASELDATVAESEAAALAETALEAVRRREAASIAVGSLLGWAEPRTVRVEGPLAGPPAPRETPSQLVELAKRTRGEVSATDAERVALQSQVQLVERSRVPNLTISGFADRDGFNERVLGGGLGIALPLPGLWPDRSGEIAEAKARVGQSEARLDSVRREVKAEVLGALAELTFREEAARAYPRDFRQRALRTLRTLETALRDGRLGVRDVLLSQRSLVQGLQGEVTSRRDLAIARVDLRRSVGLPLLEEVSP